jgi:crotonobetainyl-CoA:carnitine CoA-transferase CaiB-like acyl-CoA transferase
MAELGAEVTKIESPKGGDFSRAWGPPFWDGSAPHFIALNRNKRAVVADLSAQSDRDALEELIVREADAVVFNLRPGMANERGLGPASSSRASPRSSIATSAHSAAAVPCQTSPATIR